MPKVMQALYRDVLKWEWNIAQHGGYGWSHTPINPKSKVVLVMYRTIWFGSVYPLYEQSKC